MILFHKHSDYRVLCLITIPKLAAKAASLLEAEGVPIQYQFYAQGTASSRIMDMLGLGGVDKVVLISVMPGDFARAMLVKLKNALKLHNPNSGVAFTIVLTGGNAGLIKLIDGLHPENVDTTDTAEGREIDTMCEYSMIVAFVNQGFSEDVMSAAGSVGAKGGTVFHCRRVAGEEALQFWGVTIQQEREIVVILTSKTEKAATMEAINEQCGVQSEAQGVVVSVPVDSVAGLTGR